MRNDDGGEADVDDDDDDDDDDEDDDDSCVGITSCSENLEAFFLLLVTWS